MSAYYNEHDPQKAAWLRELIKAKVIAPGEVDDRDIQRISPADLVGFRQCHFFAGIGVWSYALRLAGWSDDREVWTGSCPCQPFSLAGRRGGFADKRHLWPSWHWLIEQCRPAVIFGEQVAKTAGLTWFDLVSADLENAGYAIGAAVLGAHSVGAPHIRQRLYFVGHSSRARGWGHSRALSRAQAGAERQVRGVSYQSQPASEVICLANHGGEGLEEFGEQQARTQREAAERSGTPSFWSDCEWIECRDGKTRPTEPGTFPLAYGTPARVGRVRGYGDAIVAPLAAEFIGAVKDHIA